MQRHACENCSQSLIHIIVRKSQIFGIICGMYFPNSVYESSFSSNTKSYNGNHQRALLNYDHRPILYKSLHSRFVHWYSKPHIMPERKTKNMELKQHTISIPSLCNVHHSKTMHTLTSLMS